MTDRFTRPVPVDLDRVLADLCVCGEQLDDIEVDVARDDPTELTVVCAGCGREW